jgi:hypothetical protein
MPLFLKEKSAIISEQLRCPCYPRFNATNKCFWACPKSVVNSYKKEKIRMKKISILLLSSFIIFALGCKSEKVNSENPATNNEVVQKDSTQAAAKPSQADLAKKVEDYELSTIDSEVITPKSIPAKWMIVPGTRVGSIRKNSTLATVEAAYGKENVAIEGVETIGTSQNGTPIKGVRTKIFRGTDNEIEIIWGDTTSIKNPIVIRILGTGKGNWITNTNVTIGTSVDYLLVLNRKDFYFLGFDEATYGGRYNGMVTWNKGRLPNTFGVSLEPSLMSKSLPVLEGFQTLAKFPTNHPDVPSLGLTVNKMSFTFH